MGNKVCTGYGANEPRSSTNDCNECYMGMYEALDDSNIKTAVNLWFDDRSTAESIYDKIKCWNVSMVTNMHDLFGFWRSFNEDIKWWDVSNVIDMSFMFYWASSFDQDLDSWDVS